MIGKVEIITNMQPQTELEKSILRVFNGVATKLNEVIDTVNKQEQVIKTLIDGLERFAKSQQEVNMEITAMITKGGDNE